MRSRQIFPWPLLVLVLVLVGGGALFWWNNDSETNTARSVPTGQATASTQDENNLTDVQKALKDIQSTQKGNADLIAGLQQQGKSLSDQVSDLQARVNGLEGSRAEYNGSERRRRHRR